MRTPLVLLTGALTLTVSAVASAQEEEECPPGAWFCEEAPPAEPETRAVPVDRPEPPEAVEVPDKKDSKGPAVVVYYPKGEPPPKIVVDKDTASPKPPKRKRKKKEWGLNLRLQGALMGDSDDRHPDSGMGGLGFSLRYRPIPHFAFDVGADFLGGVDYNGHDRRESALSFSGIIFFNPKSRWQVYTIGGFGFSRAAVEIETVDTVDLGDGTTSQQVFRRDEDYSYFGGHIGLGLEWRVSKRVALNLDVVGFVRGRTDEKARFEPEFVDPDTGRTTNTSGGGLFRGGVTFYW